MDPEKKPSPERGASEMDVAKVHGALLREKQEPCDGMAPIPLWLMTAILALAFWSGGYLFFYSGGFRGDVFNESQIAWGYAPTAPGKAKDPLAIGKRVYVANCASCHQVTGLGQPGTYPPLADSDYVNGPSSRLAAIVLNGITGPIKVHGVVYNNNMPAWKGLLKDDQIAAVLTYIRQEWGNKAGAVAPEGIAAKRAAWATRSTPLTEPEILAIPPEELPGTSSAAPSSDGTPPGKAATAAPVTPSR
ncbi:MAG: cytochrome c [Verrucomicrobiae bacterium]|nr:cytochrome c [Verrucomicrobiae bacterium]